MIKKALFLFFLLASLGANAQVAQIVGRWKSIDDKDGSAKSIVLIYRSPNGMYYGKVEKLLKDPAAKCKECDGANKDQPIQGMVVINNMKEDGDRLTGGTILDPKNGKVYSCNLSLESSNPEHLVVRGSLDKRGWFGRSQVWIRVK